MMSRTARMGTSRVNTRSCCAMSTYGVVTRINPRFNACPNPCRSSSRRISAPRNGLVPSRANHDNRSRYASYRAAPSSSTCPLLNLLFARNLTPSQTTKRRVPDAGDAPACRAMDATVSSMSTVLGCERHGDVVRTIVTSDSSPRIDVSPRASSRIVAHRRQRMSVAQTLEPTPSTFGAGWIERDARNAKTSS